MQKNNIDAKKFLKRNLLFSKDSDLKITFSFLFYLLVIVRRLNQRKNTGGII